MGLQINLTPKDRSQFLVSARALYAEKVARLKMLPQQRVVLVELLFPIAFTEVAPEVEFPQMEVKGVIVQKTLITKLANRVPPIGCLVGVPLPAVLGEFLTSVQLKLRGKQLEVFNTNVAVDEIVGPTVVVSEL